MPSIAYRTFKDNLVDVNRLREAHAELAATGRGKRGLGHITRSAIVTLCACWEQYAEDLILEAAIYIKDRVDSPDDLPKHVQKVLSGKVVNAKHKLKPLELAGLGWKNVYVNYAEIDVGNMHSPKAEHIQKLMLDYLGISDKVYEAWAHGNKVKIDKFVNLRNSIAHRGRRAGKYIKFNDVGTSVELIHCTVVETDNFLSDYLTEYLGQRPWNRKQL